MQEKLEKGIWDFVKNDGRHVQTPLEPSSHYTIWTLEDWGKKSLVLFLF